MTPTPLRIADGQHISFGLIYIASARGYFEEEGLQPEFRLFPTPREAMQDLVEGHADIAGTFLTLFVTLLREKKADLGILSTLHRSDRYIGLVARQDRGIKTPQNLARKKVGVPLGTTAEHFLDLLVQSHGLQARQITKINAPTAELLPRLKSGELDAVVLGGANLLKAQSLSDLPTVTFHTDLLSETSVLVTRSVAGLPLEIQQRVLRALLKAEEDVRKNPAAALEIVLNRLPPETREANRTVWPRMHLLLRLDNVLLAALEDENEWLTLAQKAPRLDLDFRKVFLSRALENEQPLAVTAQ